MSVRLFKYLCLTCILVCVSCSSDDVDPLDSITTIRLSFVNVNDPTETATTGYSLVDTENPYELAILNKNSTYEVRVELFDDNNGQLIDLTSEVRGRGDNHRIFISADSGSFAETDTDNNGYPIGLRGTFTTGGFRTGNIYFTLYSDFDKEAATASPTLTAMLFGTIEIQFSATLIILP